jgi:hypothetical protein
MRWEKARWQGTEFFFKPGMCWNLTSGDKLKADMKFRVLEGGVHDVNAMKIVGPLWLLGYLNTNLFSEIKYNFINSTIANQLDDIKLIPIKLPTGEEEEYIKNRVNLLIKIMKEGLQEGMLGKQTKSINELEGELNHKVCEIYGIDSSLF